MYLEKFYIITCNKSKLKFPYFDILDSGRVYGTVPMANQNRKLGYFYLKINAPHNSKYSYHIHLD